MKKCWETDPKLRPTFKELIQFFNDMLGFKTNSFSLVSLELSSSEEETSIPSILSNNNENNSNSSNNNENNSNSSNNYLLFKI